MLRIHHPRPCSRPDAGVFAPQASAFTVLPAARDGEALLSVRREGGPSAEGLPAEAVLEWMEAVQQVHVRAHDAHDGARLQQAVLERVRDRRRDGPEALLRSLLDQTRRR